MKKVVWVVLVVAVASLLSGCKMTLGEFSFEKEAQELETGAGEK